MNTLQALFGQRGGYIHRKKNMTQEQLAEAVGVSVDLVRVNIERGVNAPSFRTIAKLSESLNVLPKRTLQFFQS